jgi:hypothetical protein
MRYWCPGGDTMIYHLVYSDDVRVMHERVALKPDREGEHCEDRDQLNPIATLHG